MCVSPPEPAWVLRYSSVFTHTEGKDVRADSSAAPRSESARVLLYLLLGGFDLLSSGGGSVCALAPAVAELRVDELMRGGSD